MINFRKILFNYKSIIFLVIVTFFITEIAYGINVSEIKALRNPFMTVNREGNKRLQDAFKDKVSHFHFIKRIDWNRARRTGLIFVEGVLLVAMSLLFSQDKPSVSPVTNLEQQVNNGSISAFNRVISLALEGHTDAFRILNSNNVYVKEFLKNFNPYLVVSDINNVNEYAVGIIARCAYCDNTEAFKLLLKLFSIENEYAWLYLDELFGNRPKYRAQLISFLIDHNPEILKYKASVGNVHAARALYQVTLSHLYMKDGIWCNSYNAYALEFFKTNNPQGLLEKALNGDVDAIRNLGYFLLYENKYVQNFIVKFQQVLIEKISKDALSTASFKVYLTECVPFCRDDIPAVEDFLRNFNPQIFMKKAIDGDKDSVGNLLELNEYDNIHTFFLLVKLLDRGNEQVLNYFVEKSNVIVLHLRNLFLEHRISIDELKDILSKFTFKDNPYLLCTCYISRENFGYLARIIFEKLNVSAANQGLDLNSFVKRLDSKRLFYKDFIFQLARFNQLDDILVSDEVLSEIMDELFKNLSIQEIRVNTIRLALFIEDVLNAPSFKYRQEFQKKLRQLYNETEGINRELIAVLLTVYQSELDYLDNNDIKEISKKHNIYSTPEIIDYNKLIPQVHIVFADRDAVSGYYTQTASFFIERGYDYDDKIPATENQIVLTKDNMRLVLIKADETPYDINEHIDEVGIVVSRSHTGNEKNVFKEQTFSPNSANKIFLISSCRSATVLGNFMTYYPSAFFIGINDAAYGSETNLVTYYLLEALQKRLPTFKEIKDYMSQHIPVNIIGHYVLPGDKPLEVDTIIRTRLLRESRGLSRLDNESSGVSQTEMVYQMSHGYPYEPIDNIRITTAVVPGKDTVYLLVDNRSVTTTNSSARKNIIDTEYFKGEDVSKVDRFEQSIYNYALERLNMIGDAVKSQILLRSCQ